MNEFTEYEAYHTGSLKHCATDSVGMQAQTPTRSHFQPISSGFTAGYHNMSSWGGGGPLCQHIKYVNKMFDRKKSEAGTK